MELKEEEKIILKDCFKNYLIIINGLDNFDSVLNSTYLDKCIELIQKICNDYNINMDINNIISSTLFLKEYKYNGIKKNY